MVKIDLERLEDILKFEPQEEEKGEVPSFVDMSGALRQDEMVPERGYKLTVETRLQNLEVREQKIYKLIERLADELRSQRNGLNEIAARLPSNHMGGHF
jgi:predicted  nucleic acid-binding Zn-ribbon protein